jgi:hypothetical protein
VARRVLVEQRVAEQQPEAEMGEECGTSATSPSRAAPSSVSSTLPQHVGAAGGIGLHDAPALEAHGDVLDQRAL